MSDPDLELDVEVFRGGDYGPKGSYGEAEIDAIAGGYDPARHEAPVTLDHAQRGPAHGWVKRVRRLGDRLVATLWKVSPALRDWLRAGAYRKCSVELYRSFRGLDGPYLKAVSFLGAAAPEVKGLQPPLFSEGRAHAPETETTPNSDHPHIHHSQSDQSGPVAPTCPDDAGAVTVLSDDERAVDFRGAASPAHDATPTPETGIATAISTVAPAPAEFARPALSAGETHRLVRAAFASLKRTGQFLPAWEKAGIEAFGERLFEMERGDNTTTPDDSATASDDAALPVFADEAPFGALAASDPRQSPWRWFLEFLGSLPRQVVFGELALRGEHDSFHDGADWTEGIPAPAPRATLCPRSIEMHHETVNYMNQHPGVPYAEALHRVARG